MKSEEQQCLEDRFKAKRRRERIEKAGYFAASFGILLVVWEFTRAVGLIDPKLFPSIQAVLKAFLVGLRDGSLQMHIYASFMRVLTSFTIGILLAVVFGFLDTGLRRYDVFAASRGECTQRAPMINVQC